jgi:ribonucleoside-diphosphate reductase alpha chain
MTVVVGPQTPASVATFKQKYTQRGESFRDVANRVAAKLADDDSHYKAFREIILSQRFWPGGRILSNIGTTKSTTPYNCFVSGTIRDAFVSGQGSIMQRAMEAAATLRMGGGIGYDFSTLRPRGDAITKIDGQATGPVSFMDIFNSVGKCTSSTGQRRGAQMGILRVDHPDIEEFIHSKQNSNQLNAFNISIAITDEFMQAVQDNEEFNLQFGGRVYRSVDARDLWESIMRSTWDWGEPGVVFIDNINKQNNLYYCETIAATNPCSEQPLPPFGACLLGYFNLTQYLYKNNGEYFFNTPQFIRDIPIVVRAMDNVVDIATYPLPEQEDEAKSKRRMGLGVMGVANALEACGFPYASKDFLSELDRILDILKNYAYISSAYLAKEKGPFQLYDKDKYLDGQFMKGMSDVARKLIQEYGIRNSHLTSIAPTGTTSFCADNVSSGIEPVWDYKSQRTVITPDGPVVYTVEDYGASVLGIKGRKAVELAAEDHINVLVTAQKHIDSAISKTCNVPNTMSWHDFKEVYRKAWKGGAKGCATFTTVVDESLGGGRREGILKPVADCENGICAVA